MKVKGGDHPFAAISYGKGTGSKGGPASKELRWDDVRGSERVPNYLWVRSKTALYPCSSRPGRSDDAYVAIRCPHTI